MERGGFQKNTVGNQESGRHFAISCSMFLSINPKARKKTRIQVYYFNDDTIFI